MGYMHIDNLYKSQQILMFRECWALEKLHGTSAHVSWKDGKLHFFAGGCKHDTFVAIFDQALIEENFKTLGYEEVTVFGEAYGGSMQGNSWRYGDKLRFCAFEVRVGDTWLNVPNASDVASKLGFEFVHYVKCGTDLAAIDAERDAPSEQARRNGIEGDQPREGVVLRPLQEMVDSRGSRIMAKHKRDEERETKEPRRVVDPAKLAVLTKARDVAEEWVTPTRLQHVLDKMPTETCLDNMRDVLTAMPEDVKREGAGEIGEWSKDTDREVCRKTAELFKKSMNDRLKAVSGG